MGAINFDAQGWNSWPVPDGVKSVDVILNGAGSAPTRGGRVTGKLAVKSTDTLYVYIGDAGNANSGTSGGATTAGGSAGAAGGGGGDGTIRGGYSGGGGTFLRVNSHDSNLKAVAGGAGGRSGDYAVPVPAPGDPTPDPIGNGGKGGPSNAESGWRGFSGTGQTENATGGTPTQGGNFGTSSVSTSLNGTSAASVTLSRGGLGGDGGRYGGGGGGGGWRGGGGGNAASADGVAPGGGGGGGSNYTGGLTQATSDQGLGNTGKGSARFEWNNPEAPNQPPNIPTDLKFGSPQRPGPIAEVSTGVLTKSKGRVTVYATLDDPDGNKVRMRVQYSKNKNMSGAQDEHSAWVLPKNTDKNDTGRAEVTLTGLSQNTRYYVRVWAQDIQGKSSLNYNSSSFWTNQAPKAPTQLVPIENAAFADNSSIMFTWNHIDSDPADPQSGFKLEFRQIGNATVVKFPPDGGWKDTGSEQWEFDPYTFRANTFYEWRVKTKDQQDLGGEFSPWRSFYISGVTTSPLPKDPVKDQAVEAEFDYTFRWKFQDPDAGNTQRNADLRYRVVPTDPDADPEEGWITLIGTEDTPGTPGSGTPGTNQFWVIPGDTFQPDTHYEWQVRTRDQDNNQSQWSYSFGNPRFRTIVTAGSWIEPARPVSDALILGSLGCGTYRVFVYAQGGIVPLGELTPITSLQFARVRDDISRCDVVITGQGYDCGVLLSNLRTWMHELVIYRDDQRVWEGPVTRIVYATTGVSIEAKDVMNYLYRRIMKQGYDDRYRVVDNIQVGIRSAIDRARQIALNAFAEHDPNVLRYLTTFNYPDDAEESRQVLDYSKTAWEEIDDLARSGGIDYTVVGRRIIINDTHRPLGRLPEMRDEDFSDPPVVTEYGMQLCNLYAVSNTGGKYALAQPKSETTPGEFYGPIEMVGTSFGETDSATAMQKQAIRNISNRWPAPLIVRVPDNSTLNPEVNVTFDQLVPGVWIPLRAMNTLREVTQWQKLDSVTVLYDNGTEKVNVVMSPAPNGGGDPDAEEVPTEE